MSHLAKKLSRTKNGSRNRRDAAAKLGRHHHHVANVRRHFLHQVSDELVKTHDRLVIEDLNVSGMLSNHRLAQAISDAGWAELTFTPHPRPEPTTPEKGGAEHPTGVVRHALGQRSITIYHLQRRGAWRGASLGGAALSSEA
jgi:hypothetical protein